MRALAALACLTVTLAACGSDDGADSASPYGAPRATTATSTPEAQTTGPTDAELSRRPAGEAGLRVPARRAEIVAENSDFGRVLFDANGQVVYVFENDRPSESNCTTRECVRAWPPVLTEQEPAAGAGVDAGKLGTIRRGDGSLQVTYAGRPLYFYEHEGPREIRCHNVSLHGGLWWVVTPAGKPAA